MTDIEVVHLVLEGMQVLVMISMPMLVSAMLAGLLIGMFQAATQINEVTLSFIPKLIVLLLVMVIGGPWMLGLIVNYTRRLFQSIPGLIG
ncbi:MAG: flagellar biosynthesis protein FliQ [Immundisolibacteraceae bacterium]|jgi:flagellar biosynthesis protein FliQ|nr:flagellar biosynthesis protein FliQ [Immundisolibacteraceae bacterium]